MRYLGLAQVLELYRQVMEGTGGSLGVRDLDGLKAALAQPRMAFGGDELYPSVAEKAAALAFSLILNHPFTTVTSALGMLRWRRFSC